MQIEILRAHLGALIGDRKVYTDGETLAAHAHDFWLLDLQRRVHGAVEPLPLCVVQPESAADVSAILSFANREGQAAPVVALCGRFARMAATSRSRSSRRARMPRPVAFMSNIANLLDIACIRI